VAAGSSSRFVRTREADAAASASVDPVAWSEAFSEMFALIAGEFVQAPSRKRSRAYLLGLLSHEARKNGWTIAEFAGDEPGRDAAAAELLRLGR
jgi:hypothetical protein